MALIASLFTAFVATSAAATISADSHGEAPVRRMHKAHSEAIYQAPNVPASLEAVAADHEGEGVENQEVLSLSALHKDWPHCQAFPEHNWGGIQGAAQHLKKMNVVPNVSSSLACGQLCGGYTHTHVVDDSTEHIPCAAWAWVEKDWAREFRGFKSCAMFGFMQNDAGVIRFPVSEYTFENTCCTAGTPCKDQEMLSGYEVSTDRVASAYRKAERARRKRDELARKLDHTLAIAEREETKAYYAKGFSGYTLKHKTAYIIAAVLGLGVVGGVCAWKVGFITDKHLLNMLPWNRVSS